MYVLTRRQLLGSISGTFRLRTRRCLSWWSTATIAESCGDRRADTNQHSGSNAYSGDERHTDSAARSSPPRRDSPHESARRSREPGSAPGNHKH